MGRFTDNRLSARDRGYTPAWDRAASQFKRDNPHCRGCAAIGTRTPASVVDHTIPHKGDQTLFWSKANWQPACRHHHDVIKQMMEAMLATGEAAPADMRLDSDLAIKLSRKHPRVTQTGLDGWPVN